MTGVGKFGCAVVAVVLAAIGGTVGIGGFSDHGVACGSPAWALSGRTAFPTVIGTNEPIYLPLTNAQEKALGVLDGNVPASVRTRLITVCKNGARGHLIAGVAAFGGSALAIAYMFRKPPERDVDEPADEPVAAA